MAIFGSLADKLQKRCDLEQVLIQRTDVKDFGLDLK